MKYIHHLALVIFSATLVGCATPYGPVGTAGGYTNFKLEENIHKVEFSANGFTTMPDCEQKALYRCAEVTMLDGHRYFEILQGGSDVNTSVTYLPGQTTVNTSSYGTAYGTANTYGRVSGNNYYGNTYGQANAYGNSYTTITSTPPTPIQIQKPITIYVIRTSNTRKPSSYDAKAILSAALEKKLKLDPRVYPLVAAQ